LTFSSLLLHKLNKTAMKSPLNHDVFIIQQMKMNPFFFKYVCVHFLF
jgi:hypothetical protein